MADSPETPPVSDSRALRWIALGWIYSILGGFAAAFVHSFGELPKVGGREWWEVALAPMAVGILFAVAALPAQIARWDRRAFVLTVLLLLIQATVVWRVGTAQGWFSPVARGS